MKRILSLVAIPFALVGLGGCALLSPGAAAPEPQTAPVPAPAPVAAPSPEAPTAPEAAKPEPPAVTPGAYSEQIALDPEQRDVFLAATRDSEARNLRPLTVATQVVAGLNYDFRCVSEDGRRRYAVIIHRPLPQTGEPPRVVSLRELSATD